MSARAVLVIAFGPGWRYLRTQRLGQVGVPKFVTKEPVDWIGDRLLARKRTGGCAIPCWLTKSRDALYL